jgi:hypothetical protein
MNKIPTKLYYCEICGEPYEGAEGLDKAKIYCEQCILNLTERVRDATS